MSKSKMAVWFLRVGLAFVFAYASVEIYFNPANFLKYTPQIVLNHVPITPFLYTFGVAELALALWLMSGWKADLASLISVGLMIGIIACNMEHFQILFRNVAIAFGGLALMMLEMRAQARKEASAA